MFKLHLKESNKKMHKVIQLISKILYNKNSMGTLVKKKQKVCE
jgi:hypothetical protein